MLLIILQTNSWCDTIPSFLAWKYDLPVIILKCKNPPCLYPFLEERASASPWTASRPRTTNVCSLEKAKHPHNKSWRLSGGRNVGPSSSLWHSTQPADQSCQLYVLDTCYPQENSFVLISDRCWVDPRAYRVQVEGLGQWKISKDPTRNRTQKLLSCCKVSQPTVPLLTPWCVWQAKK